MCRLCESKKFRTSLKNRDGVNAHFGITSSGSTVKSPCGRTITWQYFRDEIVKSPTLPKHGTEVSLRHIRLLKKEQAISLSTPRKNSPQITMLDCQRIKNPNSVARREYRRSVHPSYLRWFIDIVEALEKSSSRSVETSNDVYELGKRYTPLLKSYLLKYEKNSEFPSCTGKDYFMTDIHNGMIYRKQNAIRNLRSLRS